MTAEVRASRWLMLMGLGWAAVIACGGQSNKAPKPVNVSGSDRIGWDQRAADASQLASFGYVIYVDGERSDLDASCEITAGTSGYACTAPLPAMAQGLHTLQLATFVSSNGTVLESSRSGPLVVNMVAGASIGARPSAQVISMTATSVAPESRLPSGIVLLTTDHVPLRLDLVVDGLNRPTDVAFAPDGRIFIAEQAGRVRLIRDGRLQVQPALTIDDIATAGEGGQVVLVLDPQFDRTHFVYVIYTRSARSGELVFCLARFRETNDRLADRVILLDNVPASPLRSTASLRFGPDGKLYAAFDDGGDARRAGDLGSFNGKILRLNPDGTTPDDQPGYTPVYASDYRSPGGLDWQAGTGMLWAADGDSQGSTRLTAVGSGNDRMKRSAVKMVFAVPPPSSAAGLSFYSGELISAFRGNLLVADNAGRALLRIRFNPQDPTRIMAMEHLLQDQVGGVRTVSTPTDGAIYICTAQALARISPAGISAAPQR